MCASVFARVVCCVFCCSVVVCLHLQSKIKLSHTRIKFSRRHARKHFFFFMGAYIARPRCRLETRFARIKLYIILLHRYLRHLHLTTRLERGKGVRGDQKELVVFLALSSWFCGEVRTARGKRNSDIRHK